MFIKTKIRNPCLLRRRFIYLGYQGTQMIIYHMKNSKKLFLLLAVIFLGIIIYISVDIASKTTFPGSKSNLKERIAPENEIGSKKDSLDNKTKVNQ